MIPPSLYLFTSVPYLYLHHLPKLAITKTILYKIMQLAILKYMPRKKNMTLFVSRFWFQMKSFMKGLRI